MGTLSHGDNLNLIVMRTRKTWLHLWPTTLILASLVLMAAQVAAATCVGRWSFDEGWGTNALDHSGLGNHGALVNGPQWTTNAWRGRALEFDGVDDFVQALSPSQLPVGNAARSVALWAKWSGREFSVSGGTRYQAVLGYGTPFVSSAFFTLERGGGTEGAYKRLFYMDWGHGLVGTNAEAFPSNTWVHVAATFDGSQFALYLNGELEAMGGFQLATVLNSMGLLIGSCPPNDGWHSHFSGMLDEVVLYDYALTQTEVQALMQPATAPFVTSPGAVEAGRGFPFHYGITTRPPATSFGAEGLPPGLEVDPMTGMVSGTPTTDGTSLVTLTVANAVGTNTAPLKITVRQAMPDYGLTGCVGYWRFDESGGNVAPDASGLGNHGALVNGPVWTADAWRGGALRFDGVNDFVQINVPTQLPLSNAPRSVTLWAKWSGTEFGGPRYQSVLGYGTPYQTGAFFSVERGGDYNYKRLFWMDWAHGLTGTTADALPANTWVHVAATHDGETLRLFLNGVVDASGDFALKTQLSPLGLLIGTCPPNDGWHANFSGVLDEVAVFDRALSPEEIRVLMNRLPANPVLSYGRAGTEFRLQWLGQEGLTYQPQASTNLVHWADYGDPQPGTNGLAVLAVPVAQKPATFFRVRVSQD